MRTFDRLFEKYGIGRQLDELMPAYITEGETFDTDCFERISLNESEEKLPTKYPVKDAPKVKGWFGLISVRYMMKVRAIRKLCIQYINSYVENALNVAKNLDKVNMFEEMRNLATDLAMSYDDKKNRERSVNTKAGLAFLSGDKALQDKLSAILGQIDTHAQKSDQLKEWADLMKLKSKEIACNVVYNETREIIEKEASEKEKRELKEIDKEFIEAGKGAEEALAEGAEKTKKNKEVHELKESFKKKLKGKTGDDVPQELRDKNGKFSTQKFNKLAKTDNGLKQLQKLLDGLNESASYVITSFDAFNESLMSKMDYAVIEIQHFDDIEKRWCVDVWKTHNQTEKGKTVAYVYEDGDVEFIDPKAEKSRQVHQEIIHFLKTHYKWYTSGKKFNESLSGTSEMVIKNSNTNFPKFDVPEADVDIVEYIKSRYREVWGCDEKWNDLYGGNWRCYSFLDRRDRYDFYMNDEYFGTIISKGKLHKRSEAEGDARRLIGTIMQDAQRNRKEDEDNWLLQM